MHCQFEGKNSTMGLLSLDPHSILNLSMSPKPSDLVTPMTLAHI